MHRWQSTTPRHCSALLLASSQIAPLALHLRGKDVGPGIVRREETKKERKERRKEKGVHT